MENKKERIFLVDDNPANLRTGKNVLSDKYTVFTAPSAEKMFGLLESTKPALILLDIEMPEMNGYAAIKVLKSNPETQDIPVIFLTGKSDSDSELDGLSLGAIDYITKPFMPHLLLKRIEVHLLVEAQKHILEAQQQELKNFNENLQQMVDAKTKAVLELHNAFSRYLAPEVINELIADPSKLNLGGEKREMTAVFTDIQSFSTIAEQLDPVHLVNLLNEYLTMMSNIIMETRGTIDKYEGDAIVAFFGAPLHLDDHAELACRSAIRIKQAEKELNKKIMAEHSSPAPLFTRIGINTGDMIVGNMGTANKMDYTVMGNAVNLASRLERVNKYYQTRGILISEYTKEKISNAFLYRTLDRVRVVGIKTPLRLYELLGFADEAGSEQLEAAAAWEKALDSFEKRDFKTAATLFDSLAERYGDDRTAEFYRSRCVQFLEAPPSPDWDGVNNISGK